MNNSRFKHVSFLWDDKKAAEVEGNIVEELIYRSNLLGADLRLTNYGGGNTSSRGLAQDPLTGIEVEVMWIKGSGGDIGTLKKEGLASLYTDKLRSLEKIYKGIEYEDDMVALFNHCIYDLNSKAPSIDTPLHGFLPFKHIDHLHPDAVIAIAAAKDGKQISEQLFKGTIGWLDWQRPGFDLGLQLKACLQKSPDLRGVILGSHGLFTWGETNYECYLNTLEVVETCAQYIEDHLGKKGPVFGGPLFQNLDSEQRHLKAAAIAPLLRGLCSSGTSMVGHFSDVENVLEFVNSHDLERLASMGTSCPDHFLRTKIAPLILNLPQDENLKDVAAIKEKILPQFLAYREMYEAYYNECKNESSPSIRDANPVILLWPQVGMFSFAKDKQTARVASEFYINAINVMRGAEAISTYTSLPRQEAFNIEYWLLEEAKLQRMPKAKALSGRIALVTGSGGGIGKAIAKKLAKEGACVIISDIDEERMEHAVAELKQLSGKDAVISTVLNVTDSATIEASFGNIALAFGGVDIIVNNAGISISKTIEDHTQSDWDLLFDILVKGQFLVSQSGLNVMRKQGLGGDIINIVSKNSILAGPNNSGYGSAKAAQAHLSRLMAAELGADSIRVNSINPDAVISESNIWAHGWAAGRAKAYGITEAELPAFYAKRTLLNETMLPDDIANACFVFVSGLLNKSTGNILNVDGGIATAFVR